MKRLRHLNRITASVLLLLVVACNNTLVPDPIDPRLPKYTEEGNNKAGAYINNEVWGPKDSFWGKDDLTIMTWNANDNLTIRFLGYISEQGHIIEFQLSGLKISKFEDLTTLEGQKIQLDGVKNAGYCDLSQSPNQGAGQIYFRSVYFSKSTYEIILSGTFGFSVLDENGNIIKISSGRFDYAVSEEYNFFSYSNNTNTKEAF